MFLIVRKHSQPEIYFFQQHNKIPRAAIKIHKKE